MADRWLGTLHITTILCQVKPGTHEVVTPVSLSKELIYTSIDYPDMNTARLAAIDLQKLTSQYDAGAIPKPGRVFHLLAEYMIGATPVGANNYRN